MKTKEQVDLQIEQLATGEALLVSIKGTSTSKIQFTVAEKILDPQANPLALLNASDSRFGGGRARRAWLTAEPEDAKKYFPKYAREIDNAANGDKSTEIFIGELDPMLVGQRMRVEIQETVTPTDYQSANVETTAKRRGADGAIITCGGLPVFANTRVVLNQAKHVYLTPDAVASTSTVMPAFEASVEDSIA